jgi:acid phosphatase (class A)
VGDAGLKASRRKLLASLGTALLVAAVISWLQERSDGPHYLSSPPERFAAQFTSPATPGSTDTRRELDELLALQAARTSDEIAAARADRKTRVEKFYGALGFGADPPALPKLERLAERVEDDVRIYVRAAKERSRRLRPYEIEPRLQPCIDDVRGDLSFPSGHAAYGWSMAYLLSAMVPERGAELQARAEEYARQRMVCGVHFRSDLEAGRLAARQLLAEMQQDPEFRTEEAAAAAEVRAALGLGPVPRS